MILTALVLGGIPAGAQPTTPNVTVNGSPVALDPPAVDRGGRIFVPARGVFERLGASVVYRGGSGGAINATKGTTTIALPLAGKTAVIDGQPVLHDPIFVERGRAFVPLRFLAQALGASVTYEAATQTVRISLPPPGRRALRFPQGR